MKYPYRKVLLPAAGLLGGVHPDILSYAGAAAGLLAGICFWQAGVLPWLLLLAVGLTVLRMTLNTLDGVVAIRGGYDTWLHGEIVNALPDRYADVFFVIGIGLSSYCAVGWGAAGLASMFLVSYTGMLGKAVGVRWQHQGPLGKVERLLLVMVFSLIQYVVGDGTLCTVAGIALTPLEACMVLYVLLGQATVYNRVRGIVREINRLEWPRKRPGDPAWRCLVVYASRTGNTEKAAREIAAALGADLQPVDTAGDPGGYDLVVYGSPSIRGYPEPALQAYLKRHRTPEHYAVFFTYGAPLWGPLSVRRAAAWIRDILGRRPRAAFRCRGRHAKFGTFRNHPNGEDLLRAYLFGRRLALIMEAETCRRPSTAACSC